MPEFKDNMAKSLRVKLAEADMSARDLADKSGVSYDGIMSYLRGDTGPLLETACRLAEALGCTPNDLCGIV